MFKIWLDCIEGEKDTSPEEALKRTYDYEKVFLTISNNFLFLGSRLYEFAASNHVKI